MERWDKIEAVQRMQDCILENLKNQITMHMLAQAAGYSPWHSARIFKELTGRTPFEYIRLFRLSRAAMTICEEKMKIIDVAFDFVFNSHEGFTRAFSKEFGVTPADYSRKSVPIKLFMPESIREHYLTIQRGAGNMNESVDTNTVFVQVIERPARKVIIKRGIAAEDYYEYCDEVGCEIWEILSGIKDALYEPIGMWLPEKLIPEGTSKYSQGVEVSIDYCGDIPEGFELMELEPCKMMVFQGQPYDDCNFESAIGELWKVINNYDPKIYGFEWADEDAPRFQLAPMGYRGYIEARPVKSIGK